MTIIWIYLLRFKRSFNKKNLKIIFFTDHHALNKSYKTKFNSVCEQLTLERIFNFFILINMNETSFFLIKTIMRKKINILILIVTSNQHYTVNRHALNFMSSSQLDFDSLLD